MLPRKKRRPSVPDTSSCSVRPGRCCHFVTTMYGCMHAEHATSSVAFVRTRTSALTFLAECYRHSFTDLHRINVAWNNCFRHVLNVVGEKASDLFSSSYVIDQRRLLFRRSLHNSDNTVLRTLAYLNQNQFIATASKYGVVI